MTATFAVNGKAKDPPREAGKQPGSDNVLG